MKKVIIVLLIILLAVSQASAYTVPEQYRTGEHMNDVEVWAVSEQHIGEKWAQDNLRQMAQNGYTNAGISAFAEVNAFVKQRGVAELRAKMSYYAGKMGLAVPTLLIGI